MNSEEGIIFGYHLDGKGGASKIEDTHWKDNKGLTWLHLNYSCPTLQENFYSELVLDEWAFEALTDEEPRSRTVVNNKYLFTCLRSINLNESDEQENMVSIRILIKNNLIITSRNRELFYLKNICETFDTFEGPTTVIELLESIIGAINEDLSVHIHDIVDGLDEIEQNYLTNPSDINRDDISNLRRKVLILKRYLAPQKDALKHFFTHTSLNKYATNTLSLQQHVEENTRYIEELDLTRERCSLLQEQMTNRLSEQLNKRMYLFSMITALFLPISSVASLFGMNLGGIPGTNNAWGFLLVCFVLVVTSLALILFLRRKHWF